MYDTRAVGMGLSVVEFGLLGTMRGLARPSGASLGTMRGLVGLAGPSGA